MPAPEFWTRTGPCARLLSPAAHIYGLFRQLHNGLVRPANAPVPVVCVGNLTVGGSGQDSRGAVDRRISEVPGPERPHF